ncbi:uncharacterized protein K02A2.6-like [Bombina bombina]|uniref:uncharacterized protein K02A2.6-like n=1 Tax=Bombina bombina TaxID=8345 RepID=UPI00235B1708|nr:uncharacterized protein K02A2.6-like [Bombina bombina]
MALIGTLPVFAADTDRWDTWVEQFELYCTANNIGADKQVAVFLTTIGSAAYTTLRDILSPDKPNAKPLSDLICLLSDHYLPKPLEISERFKFYTRKQLQHEDIKTYVISLKKLASSCRFGDYLNTALRDMFVIGLMDCTVQKRLLAEDELTLKRAIEIATVMELAAKDAQMLQAPAQAVCDKEKDVFHTSVHLNKQYPARQGSQTACYRCGDTNHTANACRFRNSTCYGCGKIGHIKRVCRSSLDRDKSKKGSKSHAAFHVQVDTPHTDSEEDKPLYTLQIYSLENKIPELQAKVNIDGKPLIMEVDTGAAVSVITAADWNRLGLRQPIVPTAVTMQTYSNEIIKPIGCVSPTVTFNGITKKVRLYILPKGGPPLFGRSWIQALGMPKLPQQLPLNKLLDQSGNSNSSWINSLKHKYKTVFDGNLGLVKDKQIQLHLKENAIPKFCKPRVVPFALKPKIEAELERLRNQGIIVPVSSSEWASPIVPVRKKNGDIRICGDFRVGLNPQLLVDQYPLPRIEELFSSLAGGEKFTKIDLHQAYLQLEVHPDSRHLLTINTHKGLFQYTRMVFGIAPAPAVWQRIMDEILAGIPHTHCMLDDMLITGENDAAHKANVEAVLQRLQEFGLKVNMEKCEFFCKSLEYCAHVVDKTGLHTTAEKVKALVHAPTPVNVSQLRSYLGLLNYYHRFLPNLAHLLYPLHRLLDSKNQWVWTDLCTQAFERSKQLLLESRLLVHYDLKKPLVLACDASPYGLGAVLSHIMPDGSERPVSFASRSLTPSERNYAQIDREALAIIWAVKKFHIYIYGRPFTLITDHKPLLSILHPQKGISNTTAARLQRYALQLAAYNYSIKYRCHSDHTNVDMFSRLPMVHHMTTSSKIIETPPQPVNLNSKVIATYTCSDSTLQEIKSFVQHGWPKVVRSDLQPYFTRKKEIVHDSGCLLWGSRVIIPTLLQTLALKLLHSSHQGVVKMKQRAREYLWWPKLDTDIASYVAACNACAQTQRNPSRDTSKTWPWPNEPWTRIHVDFAGPVEGRMYLVAVDAHSKWPEVVQMSSTTTQQTIVVLSSMFARFGLPQTLVSDNGPQFISHEFETFLDTNNIKHCKTAPYFPASNGQAERFVQTLKRHLAVSQKSKFNPNSLSNFLFNYRNTPHATTGLSPAMLMFGRRLRTPLDKVRPEHPTQELNTSSVSEFVLHDRVWVRNYRGPNKWIPAVIIQGMGNRMFKVQLQAGGTVSRHVEQMRHRSQPATQISNDSDGEDIWHGVWCPPESSEDENAMNTTETDQPQNDSVQQQNITGDQQPLGSPPQTISPEPNTLRPSRNRRPPSRWQCEDSVRDYSARNDLIRRRTYRRKHNCD